jgi:hypothetical protein
MRRTLLLALLLATLPLAPGRGAPAQAQAALRAGSTTLTSVQDWERGARANLLVSNNDGGELRLDDDQNSGEFVSAPLAVSDGAGSFNASAVGAAWIAERPAGTDLSFDVRSGASARGPWSDWQPLAAGDARASETRDGELVQLAASETLRTLAAEAAYLQVRVRFATEVERASALLNEITLHYYYTVEDPLVDAGLRREELAYGPQTLSPRPVVVPRAAWTRQPLDLPSRTASPKAIVLHQTGSLSATETLTTTGQPLAVLRALEAYQREALGWSDLVYHFAIDRNGTLYEGRQNGPTSVVTPTQLLSETAALSASGLLAVGEPAVHIALIGGFDEPPGEQARETLADLVAWLGEAYRIPPLGEHRVRLADGSVVTRPNYLAHSELSLPGGEASQPAAPDPGEATRALMPELRQEADSATVRSRAFFPEGNTSGGYEERIALFNPGAITATASIILLRQGEPPVEERRELGPNTRADVDVNELLPDSSDVASLVQANQELVVERIMERTVETDTGEASEIDGDSGVRQLSRLWYFAEGSTDGGFETYIALMNPRAAPVTATLTYNLGDGSSSVDQTVVIPALSRTVVQVSALDAMKDKGFGTRVLASAPIAAERTMTFGQSSQGFHVSGGQARLAERWYFAEGTTEEPFEMRILLLNPGLQTAEAGLTFATPDGTTLERKYALPPASRLVVDVNELVPALGVATTVTSTRPILAERALYFNSGNAGTTTMGATAPSYTWRFADGRTTAGDEMYLVIANPGEGQALVTAEFLLEDGSVETQGLPLIPKNSRYALVVHELYPDQQVLAATVRATQPVVVERSLFRDDRSGGGFSVLGTPE